MSRGWIRWGHVSGKMGKMMMQDSAVVPSWRPVARAKAYELVVDQIEEQILSRALTVGDRLPGERELAARLDVSRTAVREAIRMLEAQGVVRSAVGSGPEAGTFVSSMPSEALTRLLRLHVALANFPIDDVVEARVVLERSSAALAATQASEADLAAIRSPLLGMDVQVEDRIAFNELDTAFHIAIAEAGRNRLVADITIAIRDSMRRPILERLQRLDAPAWHEVQARLQAEHHAVYDAIASGDAAASQRLIEEHIRSAHSRI